MPAGKPYRFTRMTGAEFGAALGKLQIEPGQFMRLTGASPKKVAEWLRGEEDIPAWVPMFLAACGHPEGLAAAQAEAERRLIP